MQCITAEAPDQLDSMDIQDLHGLVYRTLLPTLVEARGREEAERCILTFKVLGGLGPAATADFLQEVLVATPAQRDREHLRMDIKIDPFMGQLPDATPLPATQLALDSLLGDDIPTTFCLACNTAHWRVPHLRFDRNRVQFVSMVDATVETVAGEIAPGSPVALLATSRMLESGLYQQAFKEAGFSVVTPLPNMQAVVDTAIYGGTLAGRIYAGIKGGDDGANTTALLQTVVDRMIDANRPAAFCLSCTELPLAFGPQRNGLVKGASHSIPVINSTRALARVFVRECLRMQARELQKLLPADGPNPSGTL